MRRAAIALLLLTAPVCAQSILPPDQVAAALRQFESHPGDTPLRCDVTLLPPILNFAFRFQAGYTFHVPQAQYPGPIRGWAELTTITPEDDTSKPTYLIARQRLTEVAREDLNFDIHGVYLLGEGSYSVVSAIRDDRNRLCRKEWRIVVKPSRADRNIQSALPGYAVRPYGAGSTPETRHPDNVPPIRLTVLLNAAAFSPKRSGLRPVDRLVLLRAVTAVLERVPAAPVRLVVFSLEQHREIYRSEDFSLTEVGKVAAAIDALELATVDVHVLQKPMGHVDLLVDLINRELNAPVPADTVIFLGPPSRFENKIPVTLLHKPETAYPRFFYLQYQGPRRAAVVATPDPLQLGPPSSRGGTLGNLGGVNGSSTDSAPDPEQPIPPPPRVSTNTGSGSGGNGSGNNSSNGASAPSGNGAPTGSGGPVSGGSAGSSGGGNGGGGGGGRSGGSRAGRGLPPMPAPEPGLSDIIYVAVTRLKGKTLAIHTPADLAKAIRRIEQK